MSALLVGYARVPNHDQDLTAQQKELAALGVSAERTHVELSMLPQSCSPGALVASRRPR